MKHNISITYLFTLLMIYGLTIPKAHALYLGVDYGQSTLVNESLKTYQNAFKGNKIRGQIGTVSNSMGLAAFASASNLNADLKHDGQTFTATHKENSYGLIASFFFSNIFYLNLGYAFYKFEHIVDATTYYATGIRQTYDLSEEVRNAEGLTMGLGATLLKSSRFQIYAEYTNNKYSNWRAEESLISLGLRMSVNLSLGLR